MKTQILAVIFFVLFVAEGVMFEMEYQTASHAQHNFNELLLKSQELLKACK